MASQCARWTALILTVACGAQSEAVGLVGEVERVRLTMTPVDASNLELLPKVREPVSLTWKWRFITTTPAAQYRAALIRDLSPAYACKERAPRVLCARRFPGDRIQLDIQATPSAKHTEVQARLTATAD